MIAYGGDFTTNPGKPWGLEIDPDQTCKFTSCSLMNADGDFTSPPSWGSFTFDSDLGYGSYTAVESDKAGWTKTGIKTKCTDASGATTISEPYSITFAPESCRVD